MKSVDPLRIGPHAVRVIHPQWNDRAFSAFGGKVGHKKEPLGAEEAMAFLIGERLTETRACLQRLGFLVIEVKGFDPLKHAAFLPWRRIINDRKRLPEVNMVPHTDFDDVVLFNRGDRRTGTAIAGRTGVAEIFLQSLKRFPAELHLPMKELEYQLRSVQQGSEYDLEDDPLVRSIVSIHHALSDLLAFDPGQCWPYISQVQSLMRQKAHKHLWKGDQILLIAAEALHYREASSQDRLIDPAAIWRAHLSRD